MFGLQSKEGLSGKDDREEFKMKLEAKSREIEDLNARALEKALTYVPDVDLIKAPAGWCWKFHGSPTILVMIKFISDISLSRDGGSYRLGNAGFGHMVTEGGLSTIQISMISGIKHNISIETTCADALLSHLREEWLKLGGTSAGSA